MHPPLLFVYGSLRCGEENFPVLARAGGRFMGMARTLRLFPLERGSRWPRLRDRAGAGRRIPGELFSLPEEGWAALDGFEAPDYRRRCEMVIDGAGRAQRAWIYFFAAK